MFEGEKSQRIVQFDNIKVFDILLLLQSLLNSFQFVFFPL